MSCRSALLCALALGCVPRSRPPASPEAARHVDSGVAALERGDLDRAEAELTLAAEYAPHLPEAENGLGLVALARGDLGAARRHFETAVRADDDFAEGHANLGALELTARNAERALPRLAAALAIDPGYAPARHNLARALVALGRPLEARAEYLRLTSIAPDLPDAWAELAAVELSLGHRPAARRAATTALEKAPEHPVARRVGANLLRDAGALDEALDEHDRWLADHPSDALALADRAITLLLLGRAVEGRRDAERAAALAPREARAFFALALAHAETGNDVLALRHYERAIYRAAEEERGYPEAQYLAAQALVRLGRHRDALVAYTYFLAQARGEEEYARLVEDAENEVAWLSATPEVIGSGPRP